MDILSYLSDSDSLPDMDNKETDSKKPNYQPEFKKFGNKEEIKEPYLPIVMVYNDDYPQEVKDLYYRLACKFIAKKYTIRVNGESKEFLDKIVPLSDKYVEIHNPWKKFGEYETKHYFNSESSQLIAKGFFQGWDKLTDPVRAFLSRNIRLILGTRLNSAALGVIIWTPDGALRKSEVTPKTGRLGFIIKAASSFGLLIFNIQRFKSEAESIIVKNYFLAESD